MLITRLRQARKGLSPVVSTILLIALVVVAVSATVAIFNDVDSAPDPDIQTGIGANSTIALSEDITVEISIFKLSYNLYIFSETGKKYYTSITIQVEYIGIDGIHPSEIYVKDFDIFVYGQKLDEISPWEITGTTGAEIVTNSDNQFVGYKHTMNTIATYVVEVQDTDNIGALVYEETSFSYKAKVGTVPDRVTHTFLNEELSKVVFSKVVYNVSIIHNNQDYQDPTSGVAYWMDAIDFHNGSNSMYFLMDTASDMYDVTAGDLTGLNMTWFTSYYQIVIFAEWGIHDAASAFAETVHESGVTLLMGGTVTDISGNLNNTASEYISGVTPNVYGQRQRNSANWVQFNDTSDLLVLGLSGVREDPYIDDYGYDAANLVPDSGAIQLGISHIELSFLWWTRFTHEGPMLVDKSMNVTTGTGRVITFILNHATSTNSETIFRNMLFASVNDEERIIMSTADIQFDEWTFTVNNYREFNIYLSVTVTDADIMADTLKYTLIMDKDLSWRDLSGTAAVVVDGTPLSMPYTIVEGTDFDYLELEIGLAYGADIIEGSVITILLPDAGWMRLRGWGLLFAGAAWVNQFEWLSLDESYGTASASYN